MKFKKIVGLLSAMTITITMVGCSPKEELRKWLLDEEETKTEDKVEDDKQDEKENKEEDKNGTETQITPNTNNNNNIQSSDPNTQKAYELIKPEIERMFNEAGILAYADIYTENKCVVFSLTFPDEEFVYSYEQDNQIFVKYAQQYLINTYVCNQYLSQNKIFDVSTKFVLKSNTREYMRVLNGNYVAVDTGNKDVDNEVVEAVKNFDPSQHITESTDTTSSDSDLPRNFDNKEL